MSAVSGPSMATNIASIIRSLHPNQTRALSQKSNVHRQLISSHPLCQLSAITSPASRQYHGFSPRQTHCLSRPQRSIYQHHPSTSAHQHRAFHGIANRKFTTATPSQQPATPSPAEPATNEPTPISTDEYHKLSDAYIDTLVSQLEEMQEEREDVDVEYSAGVLTLTLPPSGTYVLNKQPPNKQIWLSSPISGPKRFDWVAGKTGGGEAPEGGLGEGREGEWVYLRDGSTLSELLEEEVGVDMGVVEVEE